MLSSRFPLEKHAHRFCGGEMSKRSSREEDKAAHEAAQALFARYPDVDTIVGNGMKCGVSGGEPNRVTTDEMELGMKYVAYDII
ncbi:ABC transporter [Phytophthora megakarya]|uniref:ABC transporter n=1 Tax=Phytophthora megakarya TaxID=4795 RepID=A0A225VIZ4_9STRA|nr:ABC transporter [Phytophthora megakarya]